MGFPYRNISQYAFWRIVAPLIGSMNKSNRTLCQDYKLDWDQKPIKILGVTFNPDVFDIWELNAPDIYQKVSKVIETWSKRKITLQGKITIIKSLAISKFVHLFIALPHPPSELIQKLNRLFFKFLWNLGPDRIKRKNIIKSLSDGRLKMIHIDNFIHALKITWLRRHIQQKYSTWNELSKCNMGLIYTLGDGYAKSKAGEIQNPFWKDLLKSWISFCKQVKIENLEDVLNSPIWYNSKLNQGHNLFIKDWYDKGVRQVVDLINETGQLYQFNDFKNKYNVNGTFLDYMSLLRKLPRELKN